VTCGGCSGVGRTAAAGAGSDLQLPVGDLSGASSFGAAAASRGGERQFPQFDDSVWRPLLSDMSRFSFPIGCFVLIEVYVGA
jgi:hypothetical protein